MSISTSYGPNYRSLKIGIGAQDPQIFLSSSGALVRFAGEEILLVRVETKTGGAVLPELLMRRLSMLPALLASRSKIGYSNIGHSWISTLAASLSPQCLSPSKRQKAEGFRSAYEQGDRVFSVSNTRSFFCAVSRWCDHDRL